MELHLHPCRLLRQHQLGPRRGQVRQRIRRGCFAELGTNGSRGIRVEGSLIAQGQVGNEVIFTSLDDDVRGDTNGTVNSPVAGQWNSIFIPAGFSGSINLDHAEVRYGSGSGEDALL